MMSDDLERAIAFLNHLSPTPPAPEAMVGALLLAEKTAKHDKTSGAYSQLLGQWRLGFITGTQRSRQRAGIVLGAGRFLPRWVKICLSYTAADSSSQFPNQGTVFNTVNLGGLQIALSGPVQFHPQQNILAFDFTQIKLSVAGLKLYDGYIHKGQEREANFYEQRLKEQAFFRYFLLQKNCIAARGKGGGLALWTRDSVESKSKHQLNHSGTAQIPESGWIDREKSS